MNLLLPYRENKKNILFNLNLIQIYDQTLGTHELLFILLLKEIVYLISGLIYT